MPSRVGRLLAVALAFSLTAAVSGAQPASPTDGSTPVEARDPNWTSGGGTKVTLFPAGNVFPVYVGDPHRPTNSIQERFYTRTDIPDSMSPRTALSGGGSFGLLRIDSSGPSGRSWQVSLDAGLDALFDSMHKLDAIGWDGNYGLTFETASRGPLALRVALFHISAHLGDEYAIRTGTARFNYTREEFAVGARWRFSDAWGAYAETGVAWTMRSDQQEPWRVQGGVEWEGGRVMGGRFAWYGATDLASMQERGWRLDAAVQGGLVARTNGRAYRVYVEYLDGRPTLGEFYKYHEAHVTLGFKMDL